MKSIQLPGQVASDKREVEFRLVVTATEDPLLHDLLANQVGKNRARTARALMRVGIAFWDQQHRPIIETGQNKVQAHVQNESPNRQGEKLTKKDAQKGAHLAPAETPDWLTGPDKGAFNGKEFAGDTA